MPPFVLALVATAAVLHATWNVLLKSSGDPLETSARAMVAASVVLVPAAVVAYFAIGAPAIPGEAWLLGIASGILEAVYFFVLSGAYRRGDVSVVYPIARGSAPILTVAAGVLLLGNRLSPLAAAGVLLLFVGILAILRPWRALAARRLGRSTDPAVLFALATGVAIASYSTVDSLGARAVAPWIYAAIFFPIGALILAAWVRFVEPMRGTRGSAPGASGASAASGASWARSVAAGLFSLVGYLLILYAYSVAPLAIVSPMRESAIVLGSAWASFRMGEAADLRDGLRRTAGAAIVVLGAVVIAVGA